MNYAEIIVIGAGPAGLMAAIAAASRGASVTVFEQLDRPGLKLLVTGGGRCNLTNTAAPSAFAKAFAGKSRFIGHALRAMGSPELRAFFEAKGCVTHAPDGLHVFPVSNSSKDVLSVLLAECRRLNVNICTQTKVESLTFNGTHVSGVKAGKNEYNASCVIIASGGRSYHKLGGTGGGYQLARQAGHTVVDPVPALAPLVVREKWPGDCAGITLRCACLSVKQAGSGSLRSNGELLFTHSGISGPVALDLSGGISELLGNGKPVGLCVRVLDEWSSAKWLEYLMERAGQAGRKHLSGLVATRIPKALSEALCATSGVAGDQPLSRVSRKNLQNLANILGGVILTVTGTSGFEKAMLTRGGVSTMEINPATMESRIMKGLFFAGEVVDVDGPCGGYNLQWAFSSGWLAGGSEMLRVTSKDLSF